MRLLLDTHVWLWLLVRPDRVEASVLEQVAVAEELRLSAASVWEAAIKQGRNKLPLPVPLADLVAVSHRDAGLACLPVEERHALAVADLPPLHRDPFDRVLVAQALVEGLTLVTADEQVQAYGVPVLFT